jgi:hypothetical protein
MMSFGSRNFFQTAAVFFAVALFLCLPSAANADYIAPGLVQVRTKAYVPAETNFPLGTYEYEINWQGIPVGSASISVKTALLPGSTNADAAAKQECFDVTANAKSGKVISIFYALNHTSESIFHSDSLTPISFFSVQTENSKTKSREISFNKNGDIAAKLWKQGRSTPEEEINFHSDNATFDPISAAFLARSLPVTEGEELTFDVFNGKHRYLIALAVDSKETIWVNGIKRLAYRVTPKVRKLTDSDGEKRLHSATIWISADDNRRDVLKLKSEILLGSVNAELLRFTPLPANTPLSAARASLQSPASSPNP